MRFKGEKKQAFWRLREKQGLSPGASLALARPLRAACSCLRGETGFASQLFLIVCLHGGKRACREGERKKEGREYGD